MSEPTLASPAAAALTLAAAHQAEAAAIKAAQLARILAAWRSLDPDRVITGWSRSGVGDRAFVLLSAGQEAVADLAADYLIDTMDVQGMIAQPPEIIPGAFAGIASDGRDLETLLATAPIRAAAYQRQGRSAAQAMQAGENFLRMAVDTQINDASRAADSVVIAASTVTEAVDDPEADPQETVARDGQAPLGPPRDPGPARAAAAGAGSSALGRGVAAAPSPAQQRAALLARLKEARSALGTTVPADRSVDRQTTGRPTGDPLSADRRAQVERIKAETLARIERERAERRAARQRPERNINRTTRSRREVTVGYVRYLTPPSCPRCVILAGKFYRWSDGFERHPMCFPAGTMVSGPGFEAATRRWYQGELVTISTASGKRLSLTGNHPVLTDRGWLPASLIQPGDQVFDGTSAQSGLGRVPDEQHVPARVEDVFGALRVAGDLTQVPASAEHFHGDGIGGEVDVVLADGLLRGQVKSGLIRKAEQALLAARGDLGVVFNGERAHFEAISGYLDAPGGFMGGGGLGVPLFAGHPAGAHLSGFLHSAQGDVASLEVPADYATRNAVGLSERQFALSGDVAIGGVVREREVSPRWDAPPVPFSMESAGGYARRGQDLILRLSGQVTKDRVVQVERVEWSGHVYSLQSIEGWMVADGIVTSNCDCRHVPATQVIADQTTIDAEAYFDSLSREQQDAWFGKANAQAIRDGADITTVVNAQAGMFVADDGRRYTGKRGRRGRSPVLKPTVWQIYKDARGDRERAKRALEFNGYIVQQRSS